MRDLCRDWLRGPVRDTCWYTLGGILGATTAVTILAGLGYIPT
jgi:hypothetical protein